mmetsp:Transcript_41680/g.107903  ORF Transcript_41680/g.107903 Transcript_41680/m.107903 type:complete len:470 (-) Transcript_41680:360-1769(-)
MWSKSCSACPSASFRSARPVRKDVNFSLPSAPSPPSLRASKNSSPVLPSSHIFARMAVTDSARFWSISAKAFRTARCWAACTADSTRSMRVSARACLLFSLGASLSRVLVRSALPAQLSSTFCTCARASASSPLAFSMAASAAVALAFISSALMSGASRVRGLASVSTLSRESSTSPSSLLASSARLCTACFCSSSSFLRRSCSARAVRACDSERATPTFWCSDRNFSKEIGSRVLRILSSTSPGSSKSYSVLLNAATSSRLRVPSESPSCLAKRSFISSSFFMALPFRTARSFFSFTWAQSRSMLRRPSATWACRSPTSRFTRRAASHSPISFDFSTSIDDVVSRVSSTALRAFSVASADATISSGVPSWPSALLASATAPSTVARASLTSLLISFMILSTFSCSSFLLFSSSTRRRSSSARCSLMSSMRLWVSFSVSVASCEMRSASEPMASRFLCCASSSSASSDS